MGTEIHAMETPDGWRYRLWQNTSDVYFTVPLTAEEITVAYLEYALEQTKDDHKSFFHYRLRNARGNALDEWEMEILD